MAGTDVIWRITLDSDAPWARERAAELARGMGMGDIKLALLIGLVTGFPLVIPGLLIGIFIGGIAAIVLLVFKLKARKDVIPYGTFLAIGPIITLFWGNEILNWYLGFF